ncbi:hypothetical protein [Pantoea sp.]|uniref:hypothetical protein n=1 Tax=Pantoea sp. TaxID=69393 RepID=UPI0028A0E25D|nr:hypothetical protein [Pantoea sp.]
MQPGATSAVNVSHGEKSVNPREIKSSARITKRTGNRPGLRFRRDPNGFAPGMQGANGSFTELTLCCDVLPADITVIPPASRIITLQFFDLLNLTPFIHVVSIPHRSPDARSSQRG